MTSEKAVSAWLARLKTRSTRWLDERSLRRRLRHEQINLYLAEQSAKHAQKAVAELRHEVVRLKELQRTLGYVPEHEYAPFRTWIVKAKDITPVYNVVLSLCMVLLLLSAFAFYRGMMP